MFRKIFVLLSTLSSFHLFAADTYESGTVYDITSIDKGLLIRLDGNRVPAVCSGLNPWGWMLIPQDSSTMISVALAMRAQGKKDATVYVSGNDGVYCVVNQYDPHDSQ